MPDTDDAQQPGVILDLDGTLVDSLDDITSSLNHALADTGRAGFGRAAVAGMIGDGARMLVSRALGVVTGDLRERVLQSFLAYYRRHCVDQTCVYPGIEAQLERLLEAQWALAVLSNKPEPLTRRCVDALLGEIPFARVLGARDGGAIKPDPTDALHIASAMRRKPSQVFLVGDSPVDVATARAAGMVSVAVEWGYRDVGALRAAGPDLLINSPSQLAQDLLTWSQRSDWHR